MLTAREQLMEDIDCIVDEYFQEYGITNDPELVKVLCDAVCRNFPTNWHESFRTSTTTCQRYDWRDGSQNYVASSW